MIKFILQNKQFVNKRYVKNTYTYKQYRHIEIKFIKLVISIKQEILSSFMINTPFLIPANIYKL